MSLDAIVAQALKNPGAVLKELDRLDYEQSFYKFVQAAWKWIDPAPFVPNWHLEAIADHLQSVTRGEIRNLLVNQPPRTSKSSIVSVAWPAWTWAQRNIDYLSGPQVQFLFSSYAMTLSLRDSLKTRRLIESPWYQELWGDRFKLTGDQNAKQRFENDKGGYRLATSVGGTLTGEGGTVICCDDPHSAIEIESDAVRESTLMWWSESLSTRLNDPKHGAYVVIMQRLSDRDLSGFILENNKGEWEHLMLPMRYEPERHCSTSIGWDDPRTEDKELLWPERFGEVEVKALETKLGQFGVAGQLQQSPVPRGGGIIKREWWNLWPPIGEEDRWLRVVAGEDGQPKRNDEGKVVRRLSYPEMSYILASLDSAFKEKEENDYSALQVWGVFQLHGKPKLLLMESHAVRLPFHKLVEFTIKVCRKRQVDALAIEDKASGQSIVQEMRRLVRDGEWVTHAIQTEGDKVARMHSVVPVFSDGLVYAPDRDWADRTIGEVSAFPRAAHDDEADACSMAIRFLRKLDLARLSSEQQFEDNVAARYEQPDPFPYDIVSD